MMDWRGKAEYCVSYYSNCDPQFAQDWWLAGLRAARKWLGLLESGGRSEDEVAGLLAVANANQRNGSGWFMMAWLVYSWAEETGYRVPPREEFFEPSFGASNPPRVTN